MVAMMKVTGTADGKPMRRSGGPMRSSTTSGPQGVGCYGIDRKEIVKIAFKGQDHARGSASSRGTLDRST